MQKKNLQWHYTQLGSKRKWCQTPPHVILLMQSYADYNVFCIVSYFLKHADMRVNGFKQTNSEETRCMSDRKRAKDNTEKVRSTVGDGNKKEPWQLTGLGREVPVRAQCLRQAPGACYSKTSHSTLCSALRWLHNFPDRTWHFTWAGCEKKNKKQKKNGDSRLLTYTWGNTPGPTQAPWLPPQNWKKFANMIWSKRAWSSWR